MMNKENKKFEKPANLIRRLMAILYDSMLLIGIIFAFGVIVFLLRKLAGDDTMKAPRNILQVFITLGMWSSCIYFYLLCCVRNGQTLGMKSWKLHLYSKKQQDLTMKECFSRCLFAHISFGLLGLGYFWCLFDKKGRCVHDILSGTTVLVIKKSGDEDT